MKTLREQFEDVIRGALQPDHLEEALAREGECYAEAGTELAWFVFKTERSRSAIDRVIHFSDADERNRFKDLNKSFDLTEREDGWGNRKFVHSHIAAKFEGWTQRAVIAELEKEKSLSFTAPVTDNVLRAAIRHISQCDLNSEYRMVSAIQLLRDIFRN